jgi:hypothetical protein
MKLQGKPRFIRLHLQKLNYSIKRELTDYFEEEIHLYFEFKMGVGFLVFFEENLVMMGLMQIWKFERCSRSALFLYYNC